MGARPAPQPSFPPGLACLWQRARAGTEIEELTASPRGGRSDALGAGAGPATGRIRSLAIVPADIATPMPDPHLLWAQHYQDRCPASEFTQPAGGQGLGRVQARGCPAPGSLFKGSGSDLRDPR
jgi:hypothetical protein